MRPGRASRRSRAAYASLPLRIARRCAPARVKSAFVTKQQLPPEDQPPGQGLIPASEQEAFADISASNHPAGPWAAGRAFYMALTRDGGTDVGELRRLVTPESLNAWGDFSTARAALLGCGMTSRADIPAPDVAYVKFVSDPSQALVADSEVMIMVRAVATLQFRPGSGRWLVHQLGDYCLPEDLPALPAAG